MTTPPLELPAVRETVRLSGPLALIGAVPVLLGFHPARSLVLVCVHGVRHRVGPALRIDLPVPADEAVVSTFLTEQAVRHATAVMLLCYTTDPNQVAAAGREQLPREELVQRCVAELRDAGVPVIDAALVRAGRVWSYLNAPATHEGSPLPGDDDPGLAHLRAANAGTGRSVLDDRSDVSRSVAGPEGTEAIEADQAIEAAFERFAQRIADLDFAGTVQTGCRTAHARLTRAVAAHLRAAPRTDEVWADLVAVMSIDLVRDAVISWCLERTGELPVSLLVALARWTSDDFAVPVLATAALVAYRSGDGALANVALERAAAIDPHDRLTALAGEFVGRGVHPTELDTLIIDWPDHPANPAAPFWFRRLLERDARDDEPLGTDGPAGGGPAQ